ncbi:MAG: hypothetical protein MUE88_00745 [Flavobacteriales bacterium]|jgi:hypothetical protein|nr:hypothetical protein [Flavobacteriales bacterium]
MFQSVVNLGIKQDQMAPFRILLFILANVALIFSAHAQADPEITIYDTYEDFETKKGRDFDHYTSAMHVAGKVTLILLHNNEKVKIKCSDIWGFRYKDALFRIDHRYDQPAKLMSYGRICYYENGPAHIAMMRDSTTSASFSLGAYCYVSVDLKDELYQFSGLKKDGKKALEHFVQINPIYRQYFDCVGHTNSVSIHRECIAKFEKDHPLED